MSCLSGSTCLFVLFGFSFFVCVEIREHIIKSFVTFACFGLIDYFFPLLLLLRYKSLMFPF